MSRCNHPLPAGWRRYNDSLRELYQLGDRELADIGISRSDIPRVAWDAATH